MLAVLAGGVGAARMLSGLVDVVPPSEITAIVPTGDDLVIHGLHVSPDIDTVTYTLAGLNNTETGWGVTDESWRVMGELEALGGQSWFRLGDRDLATHLYRTQRLGEGATLSEVTAELAAKRGVGVRLVPMSDDPVRTIIEVAGEGEISFQEYFVGRRHAVPVSAVRFEGAERSRPAPGVLEAIQAAKRVVVCPSNPIVTIGPQLAVPGVLDAVTARRTDVVAVSPIVAGGAIKGPADRLLDELGHEPSVVGVARLYAPWVATLIIDKADADRASEVEAEGMRVVVADTVMRDRDAAAALAQVVLAA